MPDKKKPTRAGHHINVIVDDETHEALERAVEAYGEKLSTVVRMLLKQQLRKDGYLEK